MCKMLFISEFCSACYILHFSLWGKHIWQSSSRVDIQKNVTLITQTLTEYKQYVEKQRLGLLNYDGISHLLTYSIGQLHLKSVPGSKGQ